MRFALLLGLFVATGCTSASEPTVIGATNSDTGTVVDASKPDTEPGDTGVPDTRVFPDGTTSPPDTEPEDASSDTPVDAPKPMPVDCFTGSFGPSSSTLVDFTYQLQVDICESSACSDFIMFNPSCELTLQVKDVPTKVIVEPSDCTILKNWLTSDLLVKYLRDTVTCYYGKDPPTTPGIPFESSVVTLTDGPVSKKTWSCTEEPFVSHRKCLNAFRGKYFPGK